jgi:excisionase family DNA binding protein
MASTAQCPEEQAGLDLGSRGLRPLNDVQDVATHLRCGRTYVFALIKAKRLVSVKVGRRRLITDEAVYAYLRSLGEQ